MCLKKIKILPSTYLCLPVPQGSKILNMTLYVLCYIYRLMLVEAYAEVNYTMMYYSQETPRAHMPFNFNFITYLNKTSSAVDLKNVIHLWLDNMPQGQWANWVVSIICTVLMYYCKLDWVHEWVGIYFFWR